MNQERLGDIIATDRKAGEKDESADGPTRSRDSRSKLYLLGGMMTLFWRTLTSFRDLDSRNRGTCGDKKSVADGKVTTSYIAGAKAYRTMAVRSVVVMRLPLRRNTL